MTGPRIHRPLRARVLLSRAIVLGCFCIASGPAFAQDKDATDVYFLRASHEYSDGHATLSTSQDVVVGRVRRGDRSMILQDFQGGAVTVESGGRTVAASTGTPLRFDSVSTYDYSDVRASGRGKEVEVFNTYLRPLIAQFPSPGAEGSWTAHTSLAALGLPAQAADSGIRINLRRENLNHLDQKLVLIEFEVPAFAYRLPSGGAVTHWARGIAVTDRDFAVVHIAATQHRATAISADGTVRPFAIRTSLHGIEGDGRMGLRLDALPQVAAAVRRLSETRGDTIMALNDGMTSETFPSEVAARLDLASYAIGEGGGNPLPITTAPTHPDPASALPPEAQARMAAFRADAAEALRSNGMSDQDADRLINAVLAPDPSRELIDRSDEITEYFKPMLRMSQDASQRRTDGNPAASDAALSQFIEIYVRQDSSMRIEERLTESRTKFGDKWEEDGKSLDDPEYQAALAAMAAEHKRLLDKRYERTLEYLRIIEEKPAGSDLGNELVPGWINDPDNPDVGEDQALFELLREEMRLELEEAEEIIRRLTEEERQREQTVYDDTDDFFLNNAFTYSSMVGIVATDLSKWGEWLATQDIRKLERLAKLAGYPNLASALTDAQNILRQSQDPGYRQWSMQAPSCNGPAGCGPSYLERWHMKTSIVALGDILADSRDIFSSGGFSDIGISGLDLSYLLRDHALEDGDIIRVRITQFGHLIYEGTINLTNAGEVFGLLLGRGVASLEIFAVNEGSASPNTAQITVDDVVRGQATQTYSLNTGQTATLRVEAGAKPGPTAGTSGSPQ